MHDDESRRRVKAMRNQILSFLFAGMALATMPGLLSHGQAPGRRATYIPYDEARPYLQTLNEIVPAELKAGAPNDLASVWPKWVARRDAEIRARLVQGDEDSVVNLLLFGTSFSRRPRITLNALAEFGQKTRLLSATASTEAKTFDEELEGRVADMIQAMATPGDNERLLFARRTLEKKGYKLDTPANRESVKQYLLRSISRVLSESAGYAKAMESARLLGGANEEFIERSKLYRDRGLSSDTSLLPNFAIEVALEAMKARGMIAAGSVRRVAIVGPGLDFTDKQDGYDFYPQQTIQPFAIIDTLVRLGLARPKDLRVTTFDLSPRVNDHLSRARQQARRGLGYVVQLPRNPEAQWKPEAIAYWQRFGDQIGVQATPAKIPSGIGELKVRAVRVRPDLVFLVTPEDLNIVLQRLNLPDAEKFDLIVATNIFVYYDVFEQSLALSNVQSMLRPGGFLLSNNALLELPSSRMRSVGYQTVVYSDRPNDGDHIVWYQRTMNN